MNNRNPNIAKEGIASRWKPGQSGNPGGRPKTRIISEAYRQLLELPMSEVQAIAKAQDNTAAQVIAAQQIIKASRGFTAAALEIGNRTEGKPLQPMTVDLGIDDKTAQTIAELATTYNLLEEK